MPDHSLSERALISLFTGRVVESLAVKQDFGSRTIGCRECTRTLGSGDRVTVPLTCYEDHSWEMEGVYCEHDAVDDVSETMGIRAENQAVVAATLEETGYHPPQGNFQPDALTLGAIEVLDYSPTADGY